MCHYLILFFFLFASHGLECADQLYIRAFDLGGGGLKTALFAYDGEKMESIEPPFQLGKCPDPMDVADWVRLQMAEVGYDLDHEIESGYFFGFSLAEMGKLSAKQLEEKNIPLLFRLPSEKVSSVHDGVAHLIASLKTVGTQLPKGPIWNFSIGTGVACGFTDDNHLVRSPSDFVLFFGCEPWVTKEPTTGYSLWRACGSKSGFDEIVADRGGVVDDRCFEEFANRWKAYIKARLIDLLPDQEWGRPAAIVFTGGHIDYYGDRLVKTLESLHSEIPLFTGPKNGGLLGAAWNCIELVSSRFFKKGDNGFAESGDIIPFAACE